MATAFKKTSILNPTKSREKANPDTIYWKNLQSPVIIKEYGAVTDVNFCPTAPYDFAVTNSMKVQIYDCSDHEPLKTITRFKDIAYCASYRNDGGLLVAGCEDSRIKLFNPKSGSLLRQFPHYRQKGHDGAVRVTKFLNDQFRLMSGSDDTTVKIWDIPTEKCVRTYTQHEDYIRSGAASLASQDIFITGAYDHTIRLWDARVDESVMCVNHGAPVESVLMFPSGGIFLSAGGTSVKVWDSLAGGRLLATLTHHHKTVTSLCFCSHHQRFMSASLDKHVKVVDMATYQVVHSLSYSAPILSHAVSPDDETLVVGMTDKMLSVQHRKPPEEEEVKKAEKRKRKKEHSRNHKIFRASQGDSQVIKMRKEILKPYDKQLKGFNHSKALDAALHQRLRHHHPEVTVSVIQTLMHRGAVRAALAGRDDQRLGILLAFVHKHLSNPQFMGTLMDVLTLILDMYGMKELMTSGPILSLLNKLKILVQKEVTLMGRLEEVMGGLDMLRASAASISSTGAAPTAPIRNGTSVTTETTALTNGPSVAKESAVAMETDTTTKTTAILSPGTSVLQCIGSLVRGGGDS